MESRIIEPYGVISSFAILVGGSSFVSILHIMGLLAINPKGLCCQITSHIYTRNSGDATNTDALAV